MRPFYAGTIRAQQKVTGLAFSRGTGVTTGQQVSAFRMPQSTARDFGLDG
ncbi:MAG TPA: hypothetical protein VMT38_09720 [Terracidiphilus sp.]|nr:hypothetical protein [Terracidiphilus sp.]